MTASTKPDTVPAEYDNPVLYEDHAALENDFDDAEVQILRAQHALYTPLYARREALTSRIPHFWPTVLEQVPPELDQYIQPSDSALLAESLTGVSVSRFEIEGHPAKSIKGSPRSFAVRFTFAPNEYFENKVLEKKFYYRRAHDESVGLVSEPVRIAWKKGKDLTGGLTDAAAELFDARLKQIQEEEKQNGTATNGNAVNGKKKGGKESDLPEYSKLMTCLQDNDETSLSFFAWFGFVSTKRWVSAEESAQATAKELEAREKRRRGDKISNGEDPDKKNGEHDEDEAEDDDQDEHMEIFPEGDDLAMLLADDLWPNAIKYFTSAREADDDEDIFSDLEEDSEDEEDFGSRPVDIRSLVGKRGKGQDAASVSPPPRAKKVQR